jgi:hypothetical protein
METHSLKRVVLERLNGLSMPHRLNGFQILFFEKVGNVRQYSTGLPKCKFRNELNMLLDEVIQQWDDSEPRLREGDVDLELRKTLGIPITKLPQAEFVITLLKRPHVEVTERWWTNPRKVEKE